MWRHKALGGAAPFVGGNSVFTRKFPAILPENQNLRIETHQIFGQKTRKFSGTLAIDASCGGVVDSLEFRDPRRGKTAMQRFEQAC